MWIIVIIILIVVVVLIINFKNDSKKMSDRYSKQGGLINRFPGFVRYCTQPLSALEEKKMELVFNTGNKIEYRLPVKINNELRGHIHFGLNHSYGTIAYCNAVSQNGNRHKGFIFEIKNPLKIPNYEPSEFEYDQIFSSLLSQMASTDEFQKLELD